MKPLSVAMIGCGAVSELYYAPALSLSERAGEAHVSVLFDPDSKRTSKLAQTFPEAHATNDFAIACGSDIDLAIVASPPRFHATQAIQLLDHGVNVLCEKPMASTVEEAERMATTARASGRLLAVGLCRRFFPVSQMIRGMVQNKSLGAAKFFEISEGGQFNWPAKSASFFQKSNSQGGVMADLGVHVLDLLIWWFGMPERVNYEDDAMGGLEANCHLDLTFPEGVSGTVRLSREINLPSRTIIEFERGWVRFRAAAANELEIGASEVPFASTGQLVQLDTNGPRRGHMKFAPTYHQSFHNQLSNVIRAVRGDEEIFIPSEEGLLSMRVIEQCYRHRKLMPLPWLTEQELQRAQAIARISQ